MASTRSTSACPTAAGSTSSPTSWASPIARSSTNSPAAPPTRRMSAARATSNIISAPRPTASSTASRSICRCCPTRRISKRSTRSCSARRARSRRCAATTQGKTVLPVLLHGDAAFAGQGIVCGMLRLLRPARLRHRRHASISSSTTRSASPPARNSRARRLIRRTSPRAVQAPILHVNGDDPEAVTFCCKLAIEFRQTFGRDIVIDMWCYRRFGHNEGDEPSFTQPLMYAAIKQASADQRDLRQAADRARAWSTRPGSTSETKDYRRASRGASSRPPISYLPNKADWFEGRWAGLGRPDEPVARPPQHRDRRSATTSCASSARS